MMTSHRAFLLLIAGLAWQPAHAASIYKWLDEAGRAIYSSFPPPAGVPAERVPAPPQPTAEQVRQAEERAQQMAEQADALEDERRQKAARAAEEARLRALLSPPAPQVIERPVYVPQPVYVPVMKRPPRRHPDKPPDRTRRRRESADAPF